MIMDRWQNENGVKITIYEDMDIDSFKKAVDGVDEWYQSEPRNRANEDAKDLIETFTEGRYILCIEDDVEDRSDLDWTEQTWNFTCSTTEPVPGQNADASSGSSWKKRPAAKSKLMFTLQTS